MEHAVAEEIQHLQVYKAALIAFIGGAAPKVAVEFGRRVIPAQDKPSFLEVEAALRKAKR
jgi:chemotaxis protein MotA